MSLTVPGCSGGALKNALDWKSSVLPDQKLVVEVPIPQAKPWLVRLASFRVGFRPERRTDRMRDEICAVLPELVDEHGEFTKRAVMARLNPGRDERRGWAVDKALQRMARSDREAGGVVRVAPESFQAGQKARGPKPH